MVQEIKIKMHEKDFSLNDLGPINIILGKNGAGKSTLLRAIYKENKTRNVFIASERSGRLYNIGNLVPSLGDLVSDNYDLNFRNDALSHLLKCLKFFRNEENLDEEERIKKVQRIANYIETKVNSLLENIKIKINTGFDFDFPDKVQPQLVDISNKKNIKSGHLDFSSGESELISLAVRLLIIKYEKLKKNETRYLLIDEPDAHLHADSQYLLINMLAEVFSDSPKIIIIIATHSTAVLSALAENQKVKIGFLHNTIDYLQLIPVSNYLKKIMPIFGAHPLSRIFNQNPILLLEGEDDERIWNQAIRSSVGKIKISPCVATEDEYGQGGKNTFDVYEKLIDTVCRSVYDMAKAFSLKDGDTNPGQILPPQGCVKRYTLNCRAAENLLLTDDVLFAIGTSWPVLVTHMDNWLQVEENKKHPYHLVIKSFKEGGEYSRVDKIKKHTAFLEKIKNFKTTKEGNIEDKELTTWQKNNNKNFFCKDIFSFRTNGGGSQDELLNHLTKNNTEKRWSGSYDRRRFDLKEIRNLLLFFIEACIDNSIKQRISTNKSWEIIVGQVIGEIAIQKRQIQLSNDSITSYIGHDFLVQIECSPQSEVVLPSHVNPPNCNRPEVSPMRGKDSIHFFASSGRGVPPPSNNNKNISSDDRWAEDYGIEYILNKYLRDIAHIIQPSLSSTSNPFSSPDGLKDYMARIAGYYAQDGSLGSNGFIHDDEGELKKPIIMVMNTQGVLASDSKDSQATGGLHWVTCVILPKQYDVLGQIFTHNTERVFFIDSLYENRRLPENFKTAIKEGMDFIGMRELDKLEQQQYPELQEVPVRYQVPPAFRNAEFHDCVNIPQQKGGSDCGWWAVYNAIMLVLTGSDKFTKAFTKRQRAPQLRERFPELTKTEDMDSLLINPPDSLEQLSLDLKKLFNSDKLSQRVSTDASYPISALFDAHGAISSQQVVKERIYYLALKRQSEVTPRDSRKIIN